MAKCFFCNKQFREDKAKVGFDRFVHCPICGMPLFDPCLQDVDHWVWLYMSERDKKKYGYYDKLKKAEREGK